MNTLYSLLKPDSRSVGKKVWYLVFFSHAFFFQIKENNLNYNCKRLETNEMKLNSIGFGNKK
jgi:hypothetical protein